jgi:hypothetical protein
MNVSMIQDFITILFLNPDKKWKVSRIQTTKFSEFKNKGQHNKQ